MHVNGSKIITFERIIYVATILITLAAFSYSMKFRVDANEKDIAEFEGKYMPRELIESKLEQLILQQHMIEEDLAEIKQLVRESNR